MHLKNTQKPSNLSKNEHFCTQQGFSGLKILSLLIAIILGGTLVWVALDPDSNGKALQSQLPSQLQLSQPEPAAPEEPKPAAQKAEAPEQAWQPTLADTNKTNPDKPAPITSYHDAVSKAAQSVVNIYTTKKVENPYADDPVFQQFFEYYGQGQEQSEGAVSLGSGVIVSADGYIVTNAHVIEKADEITVALNDGRKTLAKIVGSDPDSDLAVIKVDLEGLTPLAFRRDSILVGDVALAIGNPFGVGQTVTQGIISATGRAGLGVSSFEDFIQTDAAINPGNSGGALVDANGALIGINTVIYSRSGGSMGIGFAIPTNIVEQVMDGLIKNGKVSRGWLGIEIAPVNKSPTDLSNDTGVTIANVLSGGPADTAGLKAGDVVLSINNQPVKDANALIGTVARTTPNSELSLVVNRNGQKQNLSVTVGERPSAQQAKIPQNRQLTPEEAERIQKLLQELGRMQR